MSSSNHKSIISKEANKILKNKKKKKEKKRKLKNNFKLSFPHLQNKKMSKMPKELLRRVL